MLSPKGNQGTTHGEARALLHYAIARAEPAMVHIETVEKGDVRIETRL